MVARARERQRSELVERAIRLASARQGPRLERAVAQLSWELGLDDEAYFFWRVLIGSRKTGIRDLERLERLREEWTRAHSEPPIGDDQ